MMQQSSRFKVVYVQWVDSRSGGDWMRHAEFKEQKICVCCTVGYLLADEPDYIVVTSTVADEDQDDYQALDPITIPRVAIRFLKCTPLYIQ